MPALGHARGTSPRWFSEAKFGLLVHWGPAALYERGERVLLCEQLDQTDYRRRAAEFDASRYDPRAWAQIARQAGMRYALLSAKLSDGYCLFDTATSDFNSVALGAQRDLVADFLAAFRQAGLWVGLRYELADWQCPAYFKGPGRSPDAFGALVERAHAQVQELCTQYGLLDILSLTGDGPYTPGQWRRDDLLAAVRALQPTALVCAGPQWGADLTAVRQAWPAQAPTSPWQLELTSVQRHWGYHAGDRRWRSPTEVIERLAEVTAQGGNLALNVGPQADGRLPARFCELADEVGRWLERHAEAIYGTKPGPGACSTFGPMTAKGQTLYLHVLDWPGSELHLAGLQSRALRACFLADGWRIDFRQEGAHLYLRNLPTLPPDPADTVIAVTLDGEPYAA
ncbi:MAG: alpha-L-fucosidase [Anaerolineae bacterium]|nr:alpha-L-fucosidase [Anaerolineae bacterium]